ncbi:endonuclease/exonuclease/phosphatase family protein [Dyadobacter sp. MSC1_007]|jgi:endonuclease/exonuclease/phosphatase (EEP) superfamily protein YafD|uniref:endonuclease/exonuclease/phosphatase family protein n=1 Tax=Dyadobacter sp. MSC1_007 TaxID=2909264 RepID=UPI00202E6541|nr:endonuclease/exonuclease/phosphatase family protein [Dyadobacter sp. MSC1_007]
MKGLKRLLWFLYQCFAFYTLLVYLLIWLAAWDGWLAAFMMMSFPAVFLVHLVSLPIWFVIDRKKALLPLALLLGSGLFLSRSFAFNSGGASAEIEGKQFRLMSYNVRTFQKDLHWQGSEKVREDVREMKKWVAESKADVLCMAEYYEEDGTIFDAGDRLRAKGYKHAAYFHKRKYGKSYWGLVLVSKHPILASRDTVFLAQNGMIQADIKIGKDTVRIIGVHLYSMTLKLRKLVDQKEMDGVARESRSTFGRMKKGFIKRAEELVVLQRWVDESPYPVIVCGDFNEVPYSYVYGTLRKSMANAFEEKGRGFGFTFNQLPYFIRIDHQFYDANRLSLTAFKTFSDVKYSDHYPIMGTYRFK